MLCNNDLKSFIPEVFPISLSIALSGWGIKPKTLLFLESIPAMLSIEPFGLLLYLKAIHMSNQTQINKMGKIHNLKILLDLKG